MGGEGRRTHTEAWAGWLVWGPLGSYSGSCGRHCSSRFSPACPRSLIRSCPERGANKGVEEVPPTPAAAGGGAPKARIPTRRAYSLEGRAGCRSGKGTPGGPGLAKFQLWRPLLGSHARKVCRRRLRPARARRAQAVESSERAPSQLRGGTASRDAWGGLPGPRRRGRTAAVGKAGASVAGLGLRVGPQLFGTLVFHLPGSLPGFRVCAASAGRAMPGGVRVLRGGAHG